MSFDTLQVNTLQHATKPVWEIFDWMGTDTTGVVAYSDKTVNEVDYNNPNINNISERIIGSQYSFGTGDDISGHFGCVYYGNHEDESGGNVQFDIQPGWDGRFKANVAGIYKISYHFAIQNVHADGDRIPLFYFYEIDHNNHYVVQGTNNQGNDDEKMVISGSIVRRLEKNESIRFHAGGHQNIIRLELSADEGYTSSGFTVTRL
jgi:hypothetical protein